MDQGFLMSTFAGVIFDADARPVVLERSFDEATLKRVRERVNSCGHSGVVNKAQLFEKKEEKKAGKGKMWKSLKKLFKRKKKQEPKREVRRLPSDTIVPYLSWEDRFVYENVLFVSEPKETKKKRELTYWVDATGHCYFGQEQPIWEGRYLPAG